MKFVGRFLTVGLVTCVVFIFAGVIACWAPERSADSLKARWAQAPSQFVLVDGMQIHVRDEGPRDDPYPLVLLHGTSSSLHTWDGWAKALKPTRRVIRFDLPGFGLTGPHPLNNYSLAAYVHSVEGVVNALGVTSFVVIGNSLGGQIAWASARAMPNRVHQLVLVDAAGYAQEPQSVPIGFRIARSPVMARLSQWVLPKGLIASSLRNVYANPQKITPEQVDRYYELTLRQGNRKALARRLEQMQNPDTANASEEIKTLKLPSLILWGAKDRLIPVASAHRFTADIAGSQLVVLDDVGHVPQEEDPERSVAELRQFLAQHP